MPFELHNPDGLHDPTGFGYSHVARIRGELTLIAGQYASDTSGRIATAGFAGQVDRAFANPGVALRSAELDFPGVAQLRTFVVDHDLATLRIIGAAIGRIWGDRPPTQTLIGVASLALPGMRFEADAIAVRSAESDRPGPRPQLGSGRRVPERSTFPAWNGRRMNRRAAHSDPHWACRVRGSKIDERICHMRFTTIAVASVALALSAPIAATAQSQQPQAQQPAAQQQPGKGQTVVRSVNVVDVTELPPETKSQVDAAAAKVTETDLKGLRSSIDKSPEITKALDAKGAKSADVIVANLDQQGLLTLVTKKKG